MDNRPYFTSVRFHHYKAYRDFSIALNRFNVLVGPNNCGKSTILGAFRILAEGIRKARSRKPTYVQGPLGKTLGYVVELSSIPVATENVFYDYDDTQPATVKFRLSNDNELLLFFPESGACNLICQTNGPEVKSPSSFKTHFDVSVGYVPILGPVEHNEQLYQKEAAQSALLSHRAARNFRNIWHHFPDEFAKFRSLIKTTWPGMDIEKPELDHSHHPTLLRMFCPEGRIPREIFWAGFGFQVWCQMLTYILRGSDSSIFLIDEPDIYLHADLQRQLLSILRTLGPDILIATHSTEIITESDPDDLLIVNKSFQSAKRLKNPTQLQKVFSVLGSNLNPVLTQLAKTKRALFVEGKDFQLFSRFARKIGLVNVANRSDFAVVPVEGFNPSKVRDFLEGMERTLGSKVLAGVVFDRDYRSKEECKREIVSLEEHVSFARIHNRKELENFLLSPKPLALAISKRIEENKVRRKESPPFNDSIETLLKEITEPLRHTVAAQYIDRQLKYEKTTRPALEGATIHARLMADFEQAWNNLQQRLLLVPGKEVLTTLNVYLQENFKVSITPSLIVECFRKEDVPSEMTELLETIDKFRKTKAA